MKSFKRRKRAQFRRDVPSELIVGKVEGMQRRKVGYGSREGATQSKISEI